MSMADSLSLDEMADIEDGGKPVYNKEVKVDSYSKVQESLDEKEVWGAFIIAGNGIVLKAFHPLRSSASSIVLSQSESLGNFSLGDVIFKRYLFTGETISYGTSKNKNDVGMFYE